MNLLPSPSTPNPINKKTSPAIQLSHQPALAFDPQPGQQLVKQHLSEVKLSDLNWQQSFIWSQSTTTIVVFSASPSNPPPGWLTTCLPVHTYRNK